MIHDTVDQLHQDLARANVWKGGQASVDLTALRSGAIDELIRTAVFSPDDDTRNEARTLIHRFAREAGAVPASILPFYEAIGRGEVPITFTVPAHNIRALTYDLARALFRAAIQNDVGAFIFEIA